MKIVIVGSGNAATVLGKVIKRADHDVVQVLSRDERHAKILADILGCEYGNYITTPYKNADLYLFALTDNALHHLYEHVQLEDKIVVHTCGSVSKNVLTEISEKHGVIYPLQTLNKESNELPEIPLLIDASSTELLTFLKTFAHTISDNVSVVNDEDRLKFHIAAVFVNNFTNHLYAMADDFCAQENIDFKRLMPLIAETAARIKKYPPKEVQTGPALRQDIYTLGKHLKMLSADPDLKYIYLKLSESILKLHQVK
jgi:predicted short-subunit dehydrogenase-like oxidoreductase (DUF2520 family)